MDKAKTASVGLQGTKVKESDLVKQIKKRDGTLVPFDIRKIANAVFKAMKASGEGSDLEASMVANMVFADLVRTTKKVKNFVPEVEYVQDAVERQLILAEYVKTAKAYILYREERSRLRDQQGMIPEGVKKLVKQSSKYFKTPYNEFIYYLSYSRWIPEKGRRETWIESVDRYMSFMKENIGNKLTAKEYKEAREAILKQDVNGSQRLLWSAGKAARKTNVCAYNCSYVAPTEWQDLGDIMYISMCGAGLGFSVEAENVHQFPQIKRQTGKKLKPYVVEDSKEGWADAFVAGCKAWADGFDIDFDYSKVRPSGARLETMGGRASGPQPLIELIEFTKKRILARQNRRLSTIDLHDIICQIGLIVVSGGVRRSALISLSDLDDASMREAKSGQFYLTNGQRSMANNSAVYLEKPNATTFLDEWTSLVRSGAGERGIFNRGSLEKQVPARRWEKIKDQPQIGVNPCGEIVLRSRQFCNLSSIVVRPEDTLETLKNKVRIATLLGTYQATLTNFGYIDKRWKKNCDEERLLGVSITGYYDNPLVRDDKTLAILRDEAVKTNKKYAKRFGINESTAVTCVKPHGNSGQMMGVGSGMHPWFSKYYIRRVRIAKSDPLLQLLKDQGVPIKPEIGYSISNATTMVLEFPVKAPEGAITKDQVSAMDLLTEWKRLKVNFVEHNPSVTVYISDDEWVQVADFILKNWDIVGGLAFLPKDDHVYQLAPYEEITKEEYEKRLKEIGDIDFSKLPYYEQQDNTQGAKEYACSSGKCEV